MKQVGFNVAEHRVAIESAIAELEDYVDALIDERRRQIREDQRLAHNIVRRSMRGMGQILLGGSGGRSSFLVRVDLSATCQTSRPDGDRRPNECHMRRSADVSPG
jgi:hypothetical protein